MTLGDWLTKDFNVDTCRINSSHGGTCRGDTLPSLRLLAGIQINLDSFNKSRGQNLSPRQRFYLVHTVGFVPRACHGNMSPGLDVLCVVAVKVVFNYKVSSLAYIILTIRKVRGLICLKND